MSEEQNRAIGQVFRKEELQLLYDACICYGNRLSAVNRELNGCPEAAEYIEARTEEAYGMAERIAGCMSIGEKEEEDSYGVL